MAAVDVVTPILVFLTYTGQILFALTIIALFIPHRFAKRSLAFLSKNFLLLAGIVALTATTGSLFYSLIAGYEPCTLCWYQRIFMFPQVILLGIAYRKQDKDIISYSLPLVIIGGLFSLYHVLVENFPSSVPCSTAGPSCLAMYVSGYWYITIPMMALTAFVLITTLLLLGRRK